MDVLEKDELLYCDKEKDFKEYENFLMIEG